MARRVWRAGCFDKDQVRGRKQALLQTAREDKAILKEVKRLEAEQKKQQRWQVQQDQKIAQELAKADRVEARKQERADAKAAREHEKELMATERKDRALEKNQVAGALWGFCQCRSCPGVFGEPCALKPMGTFSGPKLVCPLARRRVSGRCPAKHKPLTAALEQQLHDLGIVLWVPSRY